MSNNELDEILASLKEQREKLDRLGIDNFKLPTEKAEEKPVIEEKIVEPPVKYTIEPPLVEHKEEPIAEVKPKAEKTKPPKQRKSHGGKSKIGLIVVGVALVIVAVISLIAVNSQSSYLKPYESKYGIDFPKGILEEMCDAYGENQSVIARLELDGREAVALSQREDGYALKAKGTSVKPNQQFKSFDVSGALDLERNYSTPSAFLNAGQCLKLTTLYEKASYKAVSAFYTNTDPKDDKGYAFPYNFYGNMTPDSFDQFRDRIGSRQLYDTGHIYSINDEIVILSADTDFMPGFKFVVVFVKVDGEFEKTTNASINNRVHYPQAYYDKNGGDNPYMLSGEWYPEIYINGSTDEVKQLEAKDFKLN